MCQNLVLTVLLTPEFSPDCLRYTVTFNAGLQVSVVIRHCPIGIGEPVFDRLEVPHPLLSCPHTLNTVSTLPTPDTLSQRVCNLPTPDALNADSQALPVSYVPYFLDSGFFFFLVNLTP